MQTHTLLPGYMFRPCIRHQLTFACCRRDYILQHEFEHGGFEPIEANPIQREQARRNVEEQVDRQAGGQQGAIRHELRERNHLERQQEDIRDRFEAGDLDREGEEQQPGGALPVSTPPPRSHGRHDAVLGYPEHSEQDLPADQSPLPNPQYSPLVAPGDNKPIPKFLQEFEAMASRAEENRMVFHHILPSPLLPLTPLFFPQTFGGVR